MVCILNVPSPSLVQMESLGDEFLSDEKFLEDFAMAFESPDADGEDNHGSDDLLSWLLVHADTIDPGLDQNVEIDPLSVLSSPLQQPNGVEGGSGKKVGVDTRNDGTGAGAGEVAELVGHGPVSSLNPEPTEELWGSRVDGSSKVGSLQIQRNAALEITPSMPGTVAPSDVASSAVRNPSMLDVLSPKSTTETQLVNTTVAGVAGTIARAGCVKQDFGSVTTGTGSKQPPKEKMVQTLGSLPQGGLAATSAGVPTAPEKHGLEFYPVFQLQGTHSVSGAPTATGTRRNLEQYLGDGGTHPSESYAARWRHGPGVGKRPRVGADTRDARSRDGPKDGRRRKRYTINELEERVRKVAEDNSRLKLHLVDVNEKHAAMEAKKHEMHGAILQKLEEQKRNPCKGNEQALVDALSQFKDLYADYGVQRKKEVEFHLKQLERQILPTNTTKMSLWTLEQDASFFNNRKKGTLSEIITRELGITDSQVGRIQERRARIKRLVADLGESLRLVKELQAASEAKHTKFDERMAKMQSFFTPRQVAQLVLWVDRNRAAVSKLKLLPS
ncbi:unnamed protein product [Discosporangium mesarthrocarpum]